MATESPLIHDGAQTIAAADYSAKQFYCVKLSTSVARTALLLAATGGQIYGILQNKPKTGDAADVGIYGITKAVVGSGGSTLGLAQMTNSDGTVTDWTSGSSYAQIGYALETGASGVTITMFVGATSPKVLT